MIYYVKVVVLYKYYRLNVIFLRINDLRGSRQPSKETIRMHFGNKKVDSPYTVIEMVWKAWTH